MNALFLVAIFHSTDCFFFKVLKLCKMDLTVSTCCLSMYILYIKMYVFSLQTPSCLINIYVYKIVYEFGFDIDVHVSLYNIHFVLFQRKFLFIVQKLNIMAYNWSPIGIFKRVSSELNMNKSIDNHMIGLINILSILTATCFDKFVDACIDYYAFMPSKYGYYFQEI